MKTISEFEERWATTDWNDFWKPLLMTEGQFDETKIRNEMHDLVFMYEQVSNVYWSLTNGKLSKPMYYASVIIGEHEQACMDAYDKGYKDAREELASRPNGFTDDGEIAEDYLAAGRDPHLPRLTMDDIRNALLR